MAGEFDPLSEYADESALRKQTDYLLGLFDEIEKRGLSAATNLKASFAIFDNKNTGTESMIDSIKQLQLTSTNYTKVLAAVSAEMDNLTDAQKAQLQVINERFKAEEQMRQGAVQTVNLIKTEIAQTEKLEAGRSALAQTIANNREQIRQEALTRTRLAAVLNAENGSLQKSQAIIDLLINKKKKLNLETEQGARVNEAFNNAIIKERQFILANADVETIRIKSIGDYTGKLGVLSRAIKGLGGLGIIVEKAFGIDPVVAEGVRELGRAIRDSQHIIEGQTLAKEENTTVHQVSNTTYAANTAFTTTNAEATDVNSVAQLENAAATEVATGAQKALKVALIGSGIAIAAVAIGYLIYKFIEWKEAAEKANQQLRFLAELNKDAAKSVGEQSAGLVILKTKIEDLKTPMATRLQAVKDIKDQYPAYFKGLTTEQILTGKVADAYDQAAAAILRKAMAQAAEGQLQEIASKKFEILQKAEQDRAASIALAAKAKGFVSSSGGTGGGYSTATSATQQKQQIIALYNIRAKGYQDEIDQQNEKQTFLLQFIRAGAVEITKIEKDKDAKSIEAIKKRLSTVFEIYKVEATRRASILQAAIDQEVAGEKKGYDDRINLLNQYSSQLLEINERQRVEDIKNKEEEAAREKKTLTESLRGKNTEQKKRINENIAILEKNLQQEINLIDKKAADDRLGIFKTNEDKFNEIRKDAAEKRAADVKKEDDKQLADLKSSLAQKQSVIEGQYSDDVQALNQQYSKGTMSLDDYNKARKKLDEKYHLDALAAEIKYTKDFLKLMADRGVDVSKEFQALTKLEQEYSDAVKSIQDENKKDAIDFIDKLKGYYQQISDVISSAIAQATSARKQAIQDELDDLDKTTQAALDKNDQITQSEEDKQKNIQLINARAAAEKARLDQESRIADRKAAEAQKAIAVFSIILDTAKAIAAASPNPFKIAFAAAIGAAELAIALSAPLPKFKDGLFHDYEGWAITGDGGKREAHIKADGGIDITPASDTLTYIKKGDRIHPDADALLASLTGAALIDTARMSRANMTDESYGDMMTRSLEIKLQQNADKIVNAIANKKELQLNASKDSLAAMWKHGANTIKFIDDQTNWNQNS